MMNKMMKKLAIVIAAAAMTLGAVSSVSAQECDKTEYCTAQDFLAVREAPDANSRQVGEFHYGQDVNVIDTDDFNGWTKVSFNGRQCYVSSQFLSQVQPASNYSWLKTKSNEATKQEYTVNVAPGTYLALRTSPTFDGSNEIAQLSNGTKIELINNGNGTYWAVRVPSTNQTGYVNSNYLV